MSCCKQLILYQDILSSWFLLIGIWHTFVYVNVWRIWHLFLLKYSEYHSVGYIGRCTIQYCVILGNLTSMLFTPVIHKCINDHKMCGDIHVYCWQRYVPMLESCGDALGIQLPQPASNLCLIQHLAWRLPIMYSLVWLFLWQKFLKLQVIK